MNNCWNKNNNLLKGIYVWRNIKVKHYLFMMVVESNQSIELKISFNHFFFKYLHTVVIQKIGDSFGMFN